MQFFGQKFDMNENKKMGSDKMRSMRGVDDSLVIFVVGCGLLVIGFSRRNGGKVNAKRVWGVAVGNVMVDQSERVIFCICLIQ